MEDNKTELIKALIKFQSEVGKIERNQTNKFFEKSGQRGKYADLSVFIDVTRPIMIKNGLTITQQTTIGQTGVVLITTLWHETGQNLQSFYPIKPIKDDPQAYGSAMTYARRYCYAGILGVTAENEDDDANLASQSNGKSKPQYNQAPAPKPKSQKKLEPIPANDIDKLHALEDEFKRLVHSMPVQHSEVFKTIHKEAHDAFDQMNLKKAEAMIKVWNVKLAELEGRS